MSWFAYLPVPVWWLDVLSHEQFHALCKFALQRKWKGGSTFPDGRDAPACAVLGSEQYWASEWRVSRDTARAWLQNWCRLGILTLLDRGHGRRAAIYRIEGMSKSTESTTETPTETNPEIREFARRAPQKEQPKLPGLTNTYKGKETKEGNSPPTYGPGTLDRERLRRLQSEGRSDEEILTMFDHMRPEGQLPPRRGKAMAGTT
jgi:hypothetical protein